MSDPEGYRFLEADRRWQEDKQFREMVRDAVCRADPGTHGIAPAVLAAAKVAALAAERAALAAQPSADTLQRVRELANRYERIGATEIAHQLRAALGTQ